MERNRILVKKWITDMSITMAQKKCCERSIFNIQLMSELIEWITSYVVDSVELSRKSIELQKLKTKSKNIVDTKASKRTKIKITVHKPMVNFMAKIFRNQLTEDARFDFFIEIDLFNPNYSAPSKNWIFRIFFEMFAIASNLQKKINFCQNPRK